MMYNKRLMSQTTFIEAKFDQSSKLNHNFLMLSSFHIHVYGQKMINFLRYSFC